MSLSFEDDRRHDAPGLAKLIRDGEVSAGEVIERPPSPEHRRSTPPSTPSSSRYTIGREPWRPTRWNGRSPEFPGRCGRATIRLNDPIKSSLALSVRLSLDADAPRLASPS